MYEKETVLYKRSDYLGQKKTIHLAYDVNMLIEATALHPDGSEEPLMTFELNDISKIMENDIMQKETTTRPKLSLSFELSRSHLIQLLSAKIAADETVLEEVEVPKLETKDEDKKEEDGEEEKTEENDADAEKTEEATEETQAEGEGEAAAEEEVEKEYKEVIVPHTFNVDDVKETPIGARLLTKEQKKEAAKRIKALDQRDKDKQMSDEAKNAYESLIYSLRDWLRDSDNEIYVEESEREALFVKLDDGEEWLYDDGANVAYTKY